MRDGELVFADFEKMRQNNRYLAILKLEVFGGEGNERLEVKIGGGVIMIAQEFPGGREATIRANQPESPHGLITYMDRT